MAGPRDDPDATDGNDELDETSFPAWREAMAAHAPDPAADALVPRRYPGYPVTALPRPAPRRFRAPALDRMLAQRRSAATLATALPPLATLGRILGLAHGVGAGDARAVIASSRSRDAAPATVSRDAATPPTSQGAAEVGGTPAPPVDARGPTPSAGGLQALELYLVSWAPGWLAPGWYHHDRVAHQLAQIAAGATRDEVAAVIPSLAVLGGGALAWILVGDHARVAARYTTRATRFLLLEAGHLMQNLALVSTSCALTTVPLGGFFERALARRLALPRTDRVLYCGALG